MIWRGIRYVIVAIVATLVLWIFLLFAFAFLDANAADHAIGDLKSVTIRFKNDSELKLKTQWFINACDTVMVDKYHYSPDSGRVHTNMEIICRNLIDVEISQPPIHSLWKRDWQGSGGHTAKTTELEAQRVFMRMLGIPGSAPGFGETIPGEALLWYEETKKEEQ